MTKIFGIPATAVSVVAVVLVVSVDSPKYGGKRTKNKRESLLLPG